MNDQKEQSVIHSTFTVERSYPAPPERVFAAFADPAQKRRWFVESDSQAIETYELDFRVGGWERFCVRFREGTPLAGLTCSNDTLYMDLVPDRRMVFASTMSIGDRRISATLATIELLPSPTGTDLLFVHQGAFFEGSDGPEMREHGWKKLFEKLTREFPG